MAVASSVKTRREDKRGLGLFIANCRPEMRPTDPSVVSVLAMFIQSP